jgi:hypothetical protein
LICTIACHDKRVEAQALRATAVIGAERLMPRFWVLMDRGLRADRARAARCVRAFVCVCACAGVLMRGVVMAAGTMSESLNKIVADLIPNSWPLS